MQNAERYSILPEHLSHDAALRTLEVCVRLALSVTDEDYDQARSELTNLAAEAPPDAVALSVLYGWLVTEASEKRSVVQAATTWGRRINPAMRPLALAVDRWLVFLSDGQTRRVRVDRVKDYPDPDHQFSLRVTEVDQD